MKKIITSVICALLATFAQSEVLDSSSFNMMVDFAVSGYSGTTTLNNFPVLVKLANDAPVGFNYLDCAEDGSDVRFTDANGNLIPHEIDSWDASGTSYVWVMLPTLSGNSTAFSMYYGAKDVSSIPAVDASTVWTETGYRAVWHFAEDTKESAQGLVPSKLQGNPSFTTDGAVGKCWQSAGTAWAEYSNDPKWSALGDGSTVSISVWAKYDGGANSYARILSTMSSWTNKQGYELTIQKQINEITVGSSAQSQFQYVDDKGPGGEMVYLTAVFEADKTARLYINGVCENAQALNQVVQPTEPMHIACVSTGGNIWNGKLDELRLHATAESPDWVKACYDTMTSEEFLYSDGVFSLGEDVPLSFRVADCVQSGTQAEISGILTQLGTGASAVAVKLFYSTDSTIDENCDFVDLGTITERGQISAVISELTPAATYYYAFQLVNNAETPQTVWSDTGSFIVEASTVIADEFSLITENCKLSVSAEVLQWGIGATKVELLIGSTADSLEVVQTIDGLTSMPENGIITFDSLLLTPGSYSCSIRVTTTYNDIVWVNETPVKSISVADTATYTWIGNSGNWSDKSKWSTTEAGSAGYPSDGCSIIIGAEDCEIILDSNVKLSNITISSVGKHIFRSSSLSSARIISGDVTLLGEGGGTLVLDSVVFESKINDLAGLKQLVLQHEAKAEPASSEVTDIVLVSGATLYCGAIYGNNDELKLGKLKLVGGPSLVAHSQYTQKGVRFTSFEAVNGSGVPIVAVRSGFVAFDDVSGIEMVGGDASLEDGTSKIPVLTNFQIGGGKNSDQIYGKGACTLENGVIMRIPESTMKDTFDGAEQTDNVCISTATTLTADATVNALIVSGASLDLGGHTITVKSGVFREGDKNLWSCEVKNGVIKFCRPNVLSDQTNNADVRVKVDFATEGNANMLKPMLSHESQNLGWAHKSHYSNFVGIVSLEIGRDFYIRKTMSPTAVIELKGNKVTSDSVNIKANYGGIAGVGSVDYKYNGSNKWNCNIWLGEMSEEDYLSVTNGTVTGSVVVGNKGIFCPGLVEYDGARRGEIKLSYQAQGDIKMLNSFEIREGGTFIASINSDGTSTLLNATETAVANKFLKLNLAGKLEVDNSGVIETGKFFPIITYHEGMLAGEFSSVSDGYKVQYNVPQADGSYAVTVTKLPLGTLLIVH